MAGMVRVMKPSKEDCAEILQGRVCESAMGPVVHGDGKLVGQNTSDA